MKVMVCCLIGSERRKRGEECKGQRLRGLLLLSQERLLDQGFWLGGGQLWYPYRYEISSFLSKLVSILI
jgi:hypothetical protein